MKIKTLITVTLLCLSFAATAQNQVISQAYEVMLSNFRAPTTANSGTAFKECDDCDQMTVRVTTNTHYTVNGRTVRLQDFRKAVLQASDRDEATVIVLHHLESDTVVSIAASI
jgi:biopolymer transport protein ExbD